VRSKATNRFGLDSIEKIVEKKLERGLTLCEGPLVKCS
jgi:hypothetical protein